MDKILLLNLPRTSSGKLMRREEICWGVTDRVQLPMHLANISGLLKQKRANVKLLDANRDNLSYAELKKRLQGEKPDAVVCAITISYAHEESKIAQICKRLGIKCIGIARPFGYAEDFASKYDFYFVIYSEPEKVVGDFIDGVKREDLKGVVYKSEGKIIKTQPQPPMFRNLPSPEWDLFKPKKYEYIQYQFARGCPYRCTFCEEGTQTWQLKSVDTVLNDLDTLKACGKREVYLLGAQITTDKKWLDRFCSEKKKRGNKISFVTTIRGDEIDRGTVKKLKEAGCIGVCCGVESLNQKVLDNIDKKITVGQIRDMIRTCKEEDLHLAIFLMFGLGETDEDVVGDYVEFIRETKPTWVGCELVKVYKGTLLHERGYSYDIDEANRRCNKFKARLVALRELGEFKEDEVRLSFIGY